MRHDDIVLSFLIVYDGSDDSIPSPDLDDYDPAEPLAPYPDDHGMDVLEFFQRYDR
jgi:hypothetical protein